jgi:hypothetical protein
MCIPGPKASLFLRYPVLGSKDASVKATHLLFFPVLFSGNEAAEFRFRVEYCELDDDSATLQLEEVEITPGFLKREGQYLSGSNQANVMHFLKL